ncbi:MAG: hypothetical protein AAFY25_14055 [Pseudomonadota bacterium]
MRVIFHIGMGKTGTTSIQHALAHSTETLAAQNAHSLGMWFDAADPKFAGLAGFGQFITQSPEDKVISAKGFHAHLAQVNTDTGAETFILSNESLFHNGARMEPFLRALQDLDVHLEFLAYLRDPRAWLPSAHTQWALRHKTNKGKVEPFAKSARRLIKFYEGITFWLDHFADVTQVREATVDQDVVGDFSIATGVALDAPEARVLERPEPADTLLRAMFNTRVHQPTLPDRFNRMVRNTSEKPVAAMRDFADICFDFAGADDVIAENAGIFDYIREHTGLDFVQRPDVEAAIPDEAELQRRVIDYLIDITFQQAQRLKRLEHMVDTLRKD